MNIEVLGTGPVVRPEPGAGCDYQLVGSIAELREYLRPALQDRQPFGADWEASSLNPHIALPAGLAVSVSDKSGRYIPVGHLEDAHTNLPFPEVIQTLKDCDAAGAESWWYFVLYDFEVMARWVHWTPQHWRDIIIDVSVVDSNAIELGLKPSALRFLGERMQTIDELDEEWILLSQKQKKLSEPKRPHVLPPARVTPYACADADCTRRIGLHPEVRAAARQQAAIVELEHAFSPVLRRGNRHGVYLHRERLTELREEATSQLDALRPQIWAQLGEEFPLSRKGYLAQKVAALVPSITERTDGGAPTVSVKVLAKYKSAHPVIPLLIQYAQLTAQKENYLDKLIRASDHFGSCPWAKGRVYFAFNHVGVPTGRMKCGGGGKGQEAYLKGVVDVNAQSIPDHEKESHLPNVRSAFVAPPGSVVVALDYSQVELRIPANLAREPKWIQTFTTGGDIHTTNAQAVANVLEPGVTVTKDDKARRGKAKGVSFALLYGGDEHTIARNAGMGLPEAKAILDAFFAQLPALKQWMDAVKRGAASQKAVATFMGRVRKLDTYFRPEPPRPPRGTPKTDPAYRKWVLWKQRWMAGEREAINHPVQGGAADIFKLACIRIEEAVAAAGWPEGTVSPQVLWVHDEVVLYVKAAMVTTVVPVLRAAMEFPVKGWAVALKAEPEVGDAYLYHQKKAQEARARGDAVRAEGHLRRMAWAAPAPGMVPSGAASSWGEMVSYEDWCTAYSGRDGVGARTEPEGGAGDHSRAVVA